MIDSAQKRGELIRHPEDALALADDCLKHGAA
jgi:hypothetical protein